MKINSKIGKIAVACVAAAFFTGMAGNLWAHDGDWDSNHHYYVDKHGYWDEKDHYQKFMVHNHHHGYWDRRGDKPVFIVVP